MTMMRVDNCQLQIDQLTDDACACNLQQQILNLLLKYFLFTRHFIDVQSHSHLKITKLDA